VGGDQGVAGDPNENTGNTVKIYVAGSPVNNKDMEYSVEKADCILVSSRSNPGDPVSEGIGGNKGVPSKPFPSLTPSVIA
jgi:hypothetical protein